MRSRPPQITEAHLRRRALVYIRQSSPEQVRDHIGSTAVQRDVPRMLESWGWAADQIDVIDQDLGVTGSVPDLRQGFADLLQRIRTMQPAIVAVAWSSRLIRNHLDFAKFAAAARAYKVLYSPSPGQVIDFSDPNAEFMASIFASVDVREVRSLSHTGRRQRREKAKQGHAITIPPIGYVVVAPGAWDKHPDPRVREVLDLIFDKIWELGTAGRVVRWMAKHAVDMPRRVRSGIVWIRPTVGRIRDMARNPVYSGIYVYGKTTVEDSDEVGGTRRVATPPSEWVIVEGHHPAYVSLDRAAAIRERLNSAKSRRLAPAGQGSALVQGLVRCAIHNRTLRTSYYYRTTDGRTMAQRLPTYICTPFTRYGDSTYCCGLRAALLDDVVEAEVLTTLSPPSLQKIGDGAREALREHDALVRGRQDELRRVQQEMAEAERAFDQAPATQTFLKERLGQRYDDAARKLRNTEALHQLQPLVPPITLGADELKELSALFTSLPTLWLHPTVTAQDRKSIVREVITSLHVRPGQNQWTVTIEWVGGARTAHTIVTHAGIRAVVSEQYNVGRTDEEIVEHLAAQGFVHRIGKLMGEPYDARAVRSLIHRMKLQLPFDARAYPLIAARFNAGAIYEVVASELNDSGIRHRLGRWTVSRVTQVVIRVREGRLPNIAEVPPFRSLRARIVELASQRLSPREIAEQLSAEGRLTSRRTVVTPNAVEATFRHLHLQTPAAADGVRVATLLKEWARVVPMPEMAARLNELGLRHPQRGPWTVRRVRWRLSSLGLSDNSAVGTRGDEVPKGGWGPDTPLLASSCYRRQDDPGKP